MKPQTWLYISLFSTVAMLTNPAAQAAEDNFSDIKTEIAAQHDEGVKRLQDWIALPSIAGMDLGYPEGPEHMVQLLRDAGFQHAEIIPTDGKPGVFATLDEYFVIESDNPEVQGWDGAVLSYVEYLYELKNS